MIAVSLPLGSSEAFHCDNAPKKRVPFGPKLFKINVF